MDIRSDNVKQIASGNKKRFRRLFARLAKMDKRQLDSLFHRYHDEAFDHIDCLDCANCCKSISPMVSDVDMGRLAKAEGIKPGELVHKHFRMDEDGDYVFTRQPCPFLLDDLKCLHYEQRPRACREYPHTDRPRMYQALEVARKNAAICPAVCFILLCLCQELGL